jgi:hypothetical protein
MGTDNVIRSDYSFENEDISFSMKDSEFKSSRSYFASGIFFVFRPSMEDPKTATFPFFLTSFRDIGKSCTYIFTIISSIDCTIHCSLIHEHQNDSQVSISLGCLVRSLP